MNQSITVSCRAIDLWFRVRTIPGLLRYVASPGHAAGSRQPGRPARGPAPRSGCQSVGSNVANAVSRIVLHSASSHSLALQLTMIE
ncbi:hypothetical protein ACVWXU_003948 [Streptomyces sp. TE33382]